LSLLCLRRKTTREKTKKGEVSSIDDADADPAAQDLSGRSTRCFLSGGARATSGRVLMMMMMMTTMMTPMMKKMPSQIPTLMKVQQKESADDAHQPAHGAFHSLPRVRRACQHAS